LKNEVTDDEEFQKWSTSQEVYYCGVAHPYNGGGVALGQEIALPAY
jgi:hypothetical protein